MKNGQRKHRLIQGDCLEVIPALEPVDCIFADPPDNIGLDYKTYRDRLPESDYVNLLWEWIDTFTNLAPVVWVSFNAKWTFAFGNVVQDFLLNSPGWEAKAFVQHFTFGQNQKNDCGNGHRPLWRIKHKDAPLYPNAIKVPSWRQLNGDKRAAEGGRVPLDAWDFPRVTGNSKQRRSYHPTQLHEGLVERAIKLTTMEGQHVLDPFGGTGTTLRVCKAINRDCTLVELDPTYCQEIAKEHNLEILLHPNDIFGSN